MNYYEIIKKALKEDIGKGDITTRLTIPKHKKAKAVLLAKDNFTLCGMNLAKEVFQSLDRSIKFQALAKDGAKVKRGKVLAKISGPASPILSAERVALNFLSLLSGVATKTREYVDAAKPYKAKILDTRKTIPGLRFLQKYAVRCGGGFNHRMNLDEMVLIKDNHLAILGAKTQAAKLREKIKNIKIEIEVNSLEQFRKALKEKPDIIMLDNMRLEDIKKAVVIRNAAHPKLEVSGGVSLKNIRRLAATGVEMISVGSLTHSVESKDISLEFIS